MDDHRFLPCLIFGFFCTALTFLISGYFHWRGLEAVRKEFEERAHEREEFRDE